MWQEMRLLRLSASTYAPLDQSDLFSRVHADEWKREKRKKKKEVEK